jgi:hypothetical protein
VAVAAKQAAHLVNLALVAFLLGPVAAAPALQIMPKAAPAAIPAAGPLVTMQTLKALVAAAVTQQHMPVAAVAAAVKDGRFLAAPEILEIPDLRQIPQLSIVYQSLRALRIQ